MSGHELALVGGLTVVFYLLWLSFQALFTRLWRRARGIPRVHYIKDSRGRAERWK